MRTNTRANRAPYLPFYGDDFYGSQNVMLMSCACESVYLRLLWIAWRDGSIPADPAKIHRLVVKVTLEEFLAAWEMIAPCWVERAGRLYQPRLDEIRKDNEDYRKRRSEAGKKGNEVRWSCDQGAIANGSQTDRIGAIANGSPPLPLPPPPPIGKSTTPSLDGTDGAGAHANGREEIASLPGRGGAGREGFNILLEVGYRSKSTTRTVDILAALRKFYSEGGDDVALKKLAGRARRKGRDPGAMMAKWLDESEWQKELQRR